MQTINKGGDCLASGATRCQFPPVGGGISEEKWKEMWEGFDAEAYKNAPNPAQVKTEEPTAEAVEANPAEEYQEDQK
jgi:hypothetical protein